MAKQLYPNIVRGGMAIPLGNNYYFMKGRKHNQGGIDIGKDLEVEGGEIMKLDENNVKVFSAVPFLNGRSPVEKILGGENPNKVFAQQERFKKVNKINDDGTKAKYGKRKINTETIPESEQYAVTTPDGQRKVFNNKVEAQQYITANNPKGYSLYDTTNYGSNIDKGQTAILDRNTEREIEKATEEEIRTSARKANIESNKEYAMEALNAMPIIGDGMDIYSIVKDAYNKNYGNAALTAGMMLVPFDKLLKPVGKGIKKLYNKARKKSNVKFTDNFDVNSDNKSYEELEEEYADSWFELDNISSKHIKSSKDINTKNLQNITDRLNTNTNLIDLNTNLFNDKKLEEPTLFIEDDGKVKEVFPTPVYENNLPNLNFDNNELNKIDNYFKNIYLKKYLKNRNVNIDDINPTKPINNSTISTDLGKIVHTNPDEIEYLKETGGGFSENGIAYLDDSYKTMLPPTHEIRHNHRDSNLESQDFFKNGEEFATRLDGGTYKYPISEKYYTKKEVDLVQNGYMFPKGFESKMSEHQVLAEKANLNSDIQLYLVNKYNLQDDTQLVSKIEELSDEDLFSLLSEVNSPYAKKATSALRILRPNKDTYDAVLNNMKEALKYVPATIGVGAGLSLINNNENNQYKYGGKINRQKAPFGKGETYIQESNKNVKPNSPFRTKEDEKVSYLNRLYYSKINPLHGYPQGYIDAATNPLYLQALIEGRKTPNEMTYIVEDSVGDAAWRKRLGLSYDKKFLIDNGDGSVKLHKNRENEIPVDTNLYINRINSSKDAIKRITKQIDEINTKKYNGTFDKNDEEELKYLLEDRSLINAGINVDKETLEALRKTYKTGKAVTVNEFGYNSRNNSINGDSPLNMLQNYGIQYDKNKNVMRYFDTYDFNQFDPFVPGKPFDFKGEIKLNKKQLGGKANIYRLDSNGKSGLRMNISTGDETKARKKALLGTEDPYLSINDSYRHFVDRSKFMEEWRKRNMLYANNPIGDKPDVNKLAKEIVTKPSNAIFIEAPKDIKINYSQGLKDYAKNATTIKPSINWNKIGTAIKPYAGSIIDTVGNIATSLINASTLNKMKYTKQPIPQIANKLKTSVNINPQLKTLNESYNQYTDYINNNTASSKVAREALQRARIKNVLDTNTLYATKENTETELINKDRINQQTVANANVDNYNKWLAGKAEFDNAILDKKSENIVGAINNITSSFNTSINNIKKDRQFNNNLISVLAANPNVNPEYLRALGADWVTDKMIEDWKLANKKK